MWEYLQPLTAWLAGRLADSTDTEWAAACPDPDTGKIRDPTAVEEFLDKYDKESKTVFFKDAISSWNYDTNITSHNQEVQVGNVCPPCGDRD